MEFYVVYATLVIEENDMNDTWVILGVIFVWFALNFVILPALGVPT